LKPTTGNDSLQEISNDDGVIVLSSATSKNLSKVQGFHIVIVIHKFNWTSPDGKTLNQTDHI
jgi:hypothetical protein